LVRAQKKAALLEPPYLLIVVTVSARLSSCHRSDKPQSRKKVSLSRRAGRAATVRRATRPLSHEPLPKVRPNFLAPNPAPAIYRGARPVQSRFVCSTEKGVYAAFVRFAASPFRATPSSPAHSLLNDFGYFLDYRGDKGHEPNREEREANSRQPHCHWFLLNFLSTVIVVQCSKIKDFRQDR